MKSELLFVAASRFIDLIYWCEQRRHKETIFFIWYVFWL